jgi:hypothetical protein
MNTKPFTTMFMSSAFALLAIAGTVQAMETTTGDSMMKKEDTMMTNDSMMKKKDSVMMNDDAMMKKDEMMTMSTDLSFGSRGVDVVSLQTFLESKGLLVIPVGVTKGYFGPLTQSALMKYQSSVDVPATGYFGPITRGVMSQMMMKDEAMMKKDDSSMMKKEDTMKKDEVMKDEAMMEKKTQ